MPKKKSNCNIRSNSPILTFEEMYNQAVELEKMIELIQISDQTFKLAENHRSTIQRDQVKAYKIYCELADLSYPPAQYKLAMLYLNNIFTPLFNQDCGKGSIIPQLIEYLKEAYYIEEDQEAKRILDKIHKCNIFHAKKLLEILVNENAHTEALCSLGEMYSLSNYGMQDFSKAKILFMQAIEQGHVLAKYRLGEIYYQENNKEAAIKLYKEAAEQNCVLAICNLAIMYDSGINLELNHALAVEMLIKAAQLGNPEAQYLLGNKYIKGENLEINESEGVFWCLIAAEQGHPAAQNVVASRYYHGLGCDRNVNQAMKWYRRAAVQSLKEAFFNLGSIYLEGSKEESISIDIDKSLKYFEKAAVLGDLGAKNNLATLYNLLHYKVLEVINNPIFAYNIKHNRYLADIYEEKRNFWRLSLEESQAFQAQLNCNIDPNTSTAESTNKTICRPKIMS